MDIEIIEAVLIGSKSGNHWMVHLNITEDDGTQKPHSHMFPEDIFEHRAAELDITDQDVLLDIVMYEAHLGRMPLGEIIDSEKKLKAIKNKKGKGKIKTRNLKKGENRGIPKPVHPGVVLIDSHIDPLTPVEVIKREMLLDNGHIEAKRLVFNMHKESYFRSLQKEVDHRKRETPQEFLNKHMGK